MKSTCKHFLYFFPAAVSLIFYGGIAVNCGAGSIHPLAWGLVLLLLLAAILLQKGKWWGCAGGLLTGGILVYMGTQFTGQIINESIFGVILCVYFAICGRMCYKESRK